MSVHITLRDQFRRETAADAAEALKAYGIHGARVVPLGKLWNRTFDIRTIDGERLMLRIHPPGGRTLEELRSELEWLLALNEDTQLIVPRPRMSICGKPHSTLALPGSWETRLVSLFEWIEGRFRDRGLTPENMRQVGRTMAGLHDHATGWDRPAGFARERVDKLNPSDPRKVVNYDDAELAAAEQVAGEVLSAEEVSLVLQAIRKVTSAMGPIARDAARNILIHADLHQRNYLFRSSRAAVIDFDDCGFGPALYDFGVVLNELGTERSGFECLKRALLQGYREVRMLDGDEALAIESYVRLRQIQNVLSLIDDRRDPFLDGKWQKWVNGELRRLREYVVE